MIGTTQITDMNAFASIVKQMLEQAHPSADVEIQKVAKNNNRMLTGIAIYEARKPETEKICKDADEVLEYLIDGVRLRDIITEVWVIERTI